MRAQLVPAALVMVLVSSACSNASPTAGPLEPPGSTAPDAGAGAPPAADAATSDAAAGVSSTCPQDPDLDAAIDSAFGFADRRLRETTAWLRATYPSDATTRFPAVTSATTGQWDLTPRGSPLVSSRAEDWRSGYFPGLLYLLHRATGAPDLLEWARAWSTSLEPLATRPLDHDLGQRFLRSFGQDDTPRAREVLLTAARTLDRRFDMGGTPVGALRALDDYPPGPYPVYIDSMVNVLLLFEAGLTDHAMKHSLTVLRDHVRPDGSSFHIVQYGSDGRVHAKITDQGYSATSTWSRGQAWGIYGFTAAHRHSRDARLLEAARKMADYFLAHLPRDGVPPADFDAPAPVGRDSSAAAIACSALFELAALTSNADYREAAAQILRSLLGSYLATESPHRGLLVKGATSWNTPPVSLIYGDFHLLEAMLRYRNVPCR